MCCAAISSNVPNWICLCYHSLCTIVVYCLGGGCYVCISMYMLQILQTGVCFTCTFLTAIAAMCMCVSLSVLIWFSMFHITLKEDLVLSVEQACDAHDDQ